MYIKTIAVTLLGCAVLCTAYKLGDPNVCAKTKTVTYVSTEDCPDGKTSCVKKRKEEIDGYKCCEGYEYNTDTKDCRPECLLGCPNGTCIAPNVCHCDPPLVLEDNKCILPVCTNPCINGDCTGPDICTCHKRYAKLYSNTTCSPVCVNSCLNGNCSAPDQCTCNEGYIKDDDEPSLCYKPCEGGCEYGKCTTDGVCMCRPDLVLVNGTCMANIVQAAGVASTPGLAGLEVSWVVGGAVAVLMLVLTVVVIQRTWRRRKGQEMTPTDDGNQYGHSSVIYTVPNTLINNASDEYDTCDEQDDTTSIHDTTTRDVAVTQRLTDLKVEHAL